MKRTLEFKIDENGKSVETFLKKELDISSSLLKKIKYMPEGLVVNGNRVFTNYKLSVRDILSVQLENDDDFSENAEPTEGSLDIVFEDEDILVIDKPAGLPVHPSKGHINDSLANITAFYYKNKGLNFTFRCVNRLDKDTSGLLIVAKNAYSHDILIKEMRTGDLKRTYTAIAMGKIFPKEAAIDLNIRRIPDTATIKRETCESGGQKAITRYRVKKYIGENMTLAEINLDTGRTHQIRVHFSAIGHPLAGDWLYGNENDGIIARQALHSTKLSFIHPIKKTCMEFISELPEDMKKISKYCISDPETLKY